MEDYTKIAQEVVDGVGGAENITSISVCSTRLRVFLKDDNKIKLTELKATQGVLDVVKAMGGYQVIIGNNANRVFKVISEKYSVNTDEAKTVKMNPFDAVMSTMSAIVSPAIPAIVASGLLSALLVILTMVGMSKTSSNYTIINMVANIAFYFLPIFIAYTSALKFKANPIIAIFLAGVMLHPTLIGLVTAGTPVKFLGLSLPLVNYSSTLIPIILTIWLLSYVEKFVEKYVPSAIKYVFKPLITVIIMVPLMLFVTGPAGSYVGTWLGIGLTWLYHTLPWLGVLVVGSISLLLVMTGMHLALIPLLVANFTNLGFDNLLLPAFIGVNFTMFAVSAAVFLKSKNKNLKGVAATTAITAFLSGISEPTLYSICIKLKKPLYAAFIGSFANAIYCAIFSVKVYSFGAPSFFTLPIFIDPKGGNNFTIALGAIAVTIVVTFIATWVIGFDDTGYGEEAKAGLELKK